MARIKKFGTNKPQKLSTFETFLVDTNPNSTYFRITEFKDTFTGGKNGFLIEGSEYLQETTDIKIEVLDVSGNPVYYEPGKGIPEYYEGISKLVSVYIYEDTPIGIGKITVLGELKNFLDTGDVVRTIPDDWKGVYNVKWEREFKINRLLSNEDKVRFIRRPKIDIDEITRPIFSATPILVEQSGVVNGTPLVPSAGTRLAQFSLPTTYLLTITDNSNWSGSIIGNPVILPNITASLDSLDIITNKQLTVSTPYVVNGVVQPFFNQPYTSSFNFLDTSIPIESALSGSFAKITITDLTTFVGDVARVKVFRKSQSDVSDFQFVQEIPLESNEILVDLESSQRAQEVYGLFTPSIINEYWVSSSNDLTVGFNQDFLFNSVRLDSVGITRFFTQKELPINEGIEYSLDFNIRLGATVNSDNFVSVYLEGFRNNLTVRQNIVTVQSSNPILQKSNITANFIGDEIQNPKLIFEVNGSGWHISNVSLRASQETAFSPDEISFIQSVPRTLESETFDFRFEFYDINNNYIPVLVEKTQTFSAGNLNRIVKRLELNPSSLYFQFESGSGIGTPLPPTSIIIDVNREFLTGSINFTSRSFDIDNNEISASEYVGGQYPGLLIDEGGDIYRLTVANFTGSREDVIVQYIQYVAETEGVSDSVFITRVSNGADGVDGSGFEIRPYRGTVIRNKNEFSTLEVQSVKNEGDLQINLSSGLPLEKSDIKLFVQSGSDYITLTEASQSGFIGGLEVGTTGSNELDYNAVFNRDSIDGQLTLYLIPSSSQNRETAIISTLTLTDVLDGLSAGFIEYDVDVFTINPIREIEFTPLFSEVTASYYRRGTFENPISASVLIYPSMSIADNFTPEFWLRYQTGSINDDIRVRGFDEIGNELFSQLSSSFVGNPLEQNKQLTLSFNYIEPFTSESVLIEHTFSILPEGLPGIDAIIYDITPSNVVLNADLDGNVLDFSPSATQIQVRQGLDYLIFTGSKSPGTFFIEQSSIIGNNVTVGQLFTDSNFTQSVFISESVEFVELSGSVQYLIEVHPFFTTEFFTQSLIQPYLKVLEGEVGPGLIMRGQWTGSLDYIFNVTSKRRDVVIFPGDINETYYWAALTSSINQPPPSPPYSGLNGEPLDGQANEYWEFLGKEEFFVAAKLAIFEESFVKNTINVGNNPGSEFANIVIAGGRVDPYIAVGQNGTVGISGDQTGSNVIGYDRAGIFIGTFDSASIKTPRFSLKNNGIGVNERYLRWDGDKLEIKADNLLLDNLGNLTVTGTVNANAGNFTNTVNVGSGSITGSLLIGTDTTKITITGTNDPSSSKIFAGIGNWNSGDTGFYMDASGRFSLKNSLNWDGSNLNVSGSINATAGSIGGWVVDGSVLRDVNSIIRLDPDIPAIEIFDTGSVLRLNIRQGDLPIPDSGITITTPVVEFDPQQYSGPSTTIGVYFTGSNTPNEFTVPTTGEYVTQLEYPNSISNFIELYESGELQESINATSTFNFTIDTEIHTVASNPSVLTRVDSWGMGTANINAGQVSGDFFPSTTITKTLFLNSGITYYVYIFYSITYDIQPLNEVSFQGSTIGTTTNSFGIFLNKIDITDEGILVIGNNNNYARMRRTQSGDVLTIQGSSEFSGSVKLSNIAAGSATQLGLNASKEIVTIVSSKRYKLNIEDLDEYIVSNSLLNLRPVWYRSNPETTVDRPDWSHIGLIAEEVAEIEPRLVNYNIEVGSNGEEILIPDSVQYDRIGVILLSHIQSQTRVIEELSKKVNDLELIISGSNNL
jgi:hypothetical protein